MAEAKTLPKFRLFSIYALSFFVGISVASLIHFNFQKSSAILLFALLAISLAAIVNYLFENYSLYILSLAIFAALLGLSYYSFFDFKNAPNLIYDKKLKISGQIINKPQTDYKKQQVKVKISNARVGDEKINSMNGEIILVNLPTYPVYYFGDRVSFSGVIKKPDVIDDFDYGKYLKRYLIFGAVYQPTSVNISTQKLIWWQNIEKSLFHIYDLFEESLNRILPEPHASLAAGLILDAKRSIPDDFQNALKITGLTHIIALSGYNVTIIVAALSGIMLGYLNKKQIFWFGSILILLFIIMTGGASSIVRAAIFSLLILFGKTLGRQANQTNILLLTALLMIVVNPFVLFLDVGFQLSFLAFCGLIYISPILEKFFARKKYQKIPEWLKIILIETLAAQIAVLPLILNVFGRVSLIAPLSNILVIWIIPFAMLFAFISGLFGIFSYILGKITIAVTWPVLEYVVKIIKGLAALPFASIVISGKGAFIASVILYIIMLVWVFFSARKYKISW